MQTARPGTAPATVPRDTKPSRPHFSTTAWMSFSWVSSLSARAAAMRAWRACSMAVQYGCRFLRACRQHLKGVRGCGGLLQRVLTCTSALGARPLCAAWACMGSTPTDSAICLQVARQGRQG